MVGPARAAGGSFPSRIRLWSCTSHDSGKYHAFFGRWHALHQLCYRSAEAAASLGQWSRAQAAESDQHSSDDSTVAPCASSVTISVSISLNRLGC